MIDYSVKVTSLHLLESGNLELENISAVTPFTQAQLRLAAFVQFQSDSRLISLLDQFIEADRADLP
jgi:hypothetical protein